MDREAAAEGWDDGLVTVDASAADDAAEDDDDGDDDEDDDDDAAADDEDEDADGCETSELSNTCTVCGFQRKWSAGTRTSTHILRPS